DRGSERSRWLLRRRDDHRATVHLDREPCGRTRPASGSCSFSVTVVATSTRSKDNTTSAVALNEAASGAAATARLRRARPARRGREPITPDWRRRCAVGQFAADSAELLALVALGGTRRLLALSSTDANELRSAA